MLLLSVSRGLFGEGFPQYDINLEVWLVQCSCSEVLVSNSNTFKNLDGNGSGKLSLL